MNTQKDPRRTISALSYVEGKLLELKGSIESFLQLLESQEKVPWDEMLSMYISVSRELGQLQDILLNSAVPAGGADDARFFRSHLIVPQAVSLDFDSALHKATEGRIPSYTHEIVPEALRTKLPLDLPDVPEVADALVSTVEFEQMVKRAQEFDEEMRSIAKGLEEVIRDPYVSQITPREKDVALNQPVNQDTVNLVLAVMTGKGLPIKTLSSSK